MEIGFSETRILTTTAAHYLAAFILGNLLVAGIAKLLGVADRFWRYFAAANWTSVCFTIVTLPLTVIAMTGIVPHEEMDRAFVIVTCYGYVITGCIALRAFRVNWELAGFIAIVTLFADQEMWHLLYGVQGIPWPW